MTAGEPLISEEVAAQILAELQEQARQRQEKAFAWPAFLTARLDELEALALAASGKDGAATEGEHWQWVYSDRDHGDSYGREGLVSFREDDPVEFELWREYIAPAVSLRSVEEYPSTYVGELPHFVVCCTDDQEPRTARHIAYHDPAHVIADVAAKRTILDLYWREHAEATQDLDQTYAMQDVVEALCSPFRNHPDWPGDQK